MAGNPVPNDPDDLLALAEDIADGLQTLEAAVGVKQNTEAVMRGTIMAQRTADTQVGVAKAARGAAALVLATAEDNGRKFLLEARKVLTHYLGNTWSTAWEATGFPSESTAVPNSEEERMNLCASLKTYFTANAGQQAYTKGLPGRPRMVRCGP